MNNNTPISQVVETLLLTPIERYNTHITLERNLILNFGLLKRIKPSGIERLEISEDAKKGLISLLPQTVESSSLAQIVNDEEQDSGSCPFLFKKMLEDRKTGNVVEYLSSDEEEESIHKPTAMSRDGDKIVFRRDADAQSEDWFSDTSGGGCPFGFDKLLKDKPKLEGRREVIEFSSSDEDEESEDGSNSGDDDEESDSEVL
eukprot:TRINITY_DN1396_c0_g1_i1.p1 TRINITY_DN1396_c0_g1~~TRINITY_DN1396_c0_g1_i1.p1  ORF type:complete len:202 (-),score=57.87 TRINITY_DN1396_c0_g1_i1:322-927(-)